MTQPKANLAYLRSEKAKAEQQLRYYKHREKIFGTPDTGADPQSPCASTVYPCRNAGKFSDCAGRFHQRPGDGTAENRIPSTRSCAGSCKDDSRPAQKPQRSEPLRIKGAIIHRSGEIAVLQTAR